MNKLSSEDRSALLLLASTMPKGDEGRRAILSGLKKSAAGEYATKRQADQFFQKMSRLSDSLKREGLVHQSFASRNESKPFSEGVGIIGCRYVPLNEDPATLEAILSKLEALYKASGIRGEITARKTPLDYIYQVAYKIKYTPDASR